MLAEAFFLSGTLGHNVCCIIGVGLIRLPAYANSEIFKEIEQGMVNSYS